MNAEFWAFLSAPTKELILKMKGKRTRMNELMRLYLEHIPYVQTDLIAGPHGSYPCREWLLSLSKDVSLHCAHCRHKEKCEFECLEIYMKALGEFCELCSAECKKTCMQVQNKRLAKWIKSPPQHPDQVHNMATYKCSIKFHDDIRQLRGGVFLIVEIPPLNRLDDTEGFTRNTLENMITKWANISLREMSNRDIIELALTFVSLSFLFIWDLYHDTRFMNKGVPAGKQDDHYSRDSANVLYAFVASQQGIPADQIEETINSNINPEEVVIGPQSKYPQEFKLTWENTKQLFKAINNLYDSDFLPSLTIDEIHKTYRELIIDQVDRSILRSTSAGLDGSLRKGRTYTRYINYRAYLRLAALTVALSRVRFRHKLPTLFRDNNLQRLKMALELKEPNPTRRSSHSKRALIRKESSGSEMSLKSACKHLKLNYSTIQADIDDYKKYNPCLDEIALLHLKDADSNYGLSRSLVSYSSEEDLKIWQERVTSLFGKDI